MSLVGLTLRFPVKWKRELETSSRSGSLRATFVSLKKKLRVRLAVAFVFFFLLSGFLSLFLVGFSQLASRESEEAWLVSSFISIGLDMTLF